MAADIQGTYLDEVRDFTSANNTDKGKFRFFRYSQDFPSEQDFGENASGNDIKISGIQLQTLAQCLVDFFNYDLKDVSFDGSLSSKNSIENKDYKSTSPLSKTVGEIQSGRGKVSESVNLKIQIIKRYNNNFAKNKTNQELKSANIKLDDVAKEQIGVVGPVTYNFIIRQAIYQWFKKNYLSNPNSFLYQSLPTLDTN